MATVSLRRVRKAFGARPVLRDVTVEVPDGEFVVLVGPSGCGKSTLLRLVAGLESIDAGEIAIGDRVVNDVAPRDRDVAMVFQNYALYPHMTVARNMGFSLKLRGERSEVIDREVRAVAATLGLEPHLDRLPRHLSGGERQRVAMGRAMVRAPQVFLFDEPLSNLDAALRVQMRAEIRDLHRRAATTMIYVTHDQFEAMTMADRIVVMRDGRVEQIGRPLEVYDRPANVFVAGFIGSPAMNLVEGVVEAEDGTAFLRAADGTRWPLPPTRLAPGRRLRYGIRPPDLGLSPSGPLEAKIVGVEPTGAETQIVCQVGERRVVGVIRERLTAAPGATVRLAVDTAAVHLFDADTEGRLDP